MSVKTAREELHIKGVKLEMERLDLIEKHLPKKAWREYCQLTGKLHSLEEALHNTDAQLEWQRAGGLERCPISVPLSSGEEPPDHVDRLCEQVDCPNFDNCWATKEFKSPCDVMTDD